MPKNIPQSGQTNWGTPLNDHIKQISPPNTGGINFGTTAQRPTLTNDDEGFTFVDTVTNELVRWNGTSWIPILKGGVSALDFALSTTTLTYDNPSVSFIGNYTGPSGNVLFYTYSPTKINLQINPVDVAFQVSGSVTQGQTLIATVPNFVFTPPNTINLLPSSNSIVVNITVIKF